MKTTIRNFISSKLDYMSKTTQLTLLLCIAALVGKSQPWSEKLYAHPNSLCSSGCTISLNTPFGFLMGGFNPLAATNSPNFYIDRTKTGGQFGGGLFSNDYYVYGDAGCSTSLTQASGFYGVSVIETQNTATNTPHYIVTGAFDEGVFYTSLSSLGVPIVRTFLPFPAGAMSITKPLIVESRATAYDYFICGSYSTGGVQKMYVIKINLAGTVLQSKLYNTTNPSGGDLFPSGLIYSPYGNEVVIAGKAANLGSGGGIEDRPFLIKLNDNTLAINLSNLYGKVASAMGIDYFTTIAAAPSTTPGSAGYAVGGYTDFSTGTGYVWTLKLDAAGNIINNCNWICAPSSDFFAQDVGGLVERYSATYGTTYYGIVNSTSAGMIALKFDANLSPFSGNTTNEFVYPQATAAIPCAISALDNGSGGDIGIHIYGTDDQVNGGNTYFVEAAFNGLTDFSGCPNSYTATSANPIAGPTVTTNFTVNVANGLTTCANFTLTSTAITPTLSTLCSTNSIPAGSQNRPLSNANNGSIQTGELMISQAPSGASLFIKYSAMNIEPMCVELFDVAGRLIKKFVFQVSDPGPQTIELDLSGLAMESGIYIISTSVAGAAGKEKIVYTKN